MGIEATNLADFITPPNASSCAVLAATTTAGSLSLATVGNQTQNMGAQSTLTTGIMGHYISVQADGGDVYVVFGPTQASVTSGNVPNPTTTGTNAAGSCFKIPSGATANFLPRVGIDLWMGYVTATGTATLRLFQTSY